MIDLDRLQLSSFSPTMNDSDEDRLEDFTSLFLPDILHPISSTACSSSNIKQEDIDKSVQDLIGGSSTSPSDSYLSNPTNSSSSGGNINPMLNNHVSHYASFLSTAAAPMPSYYQHLSMYHFNPLQHLYPNKNDNWSGNSNLESFMMNNGSAIERNSTPEATQPIAQALMNQTMTTIPQSIASSEQAEIGIAGSTSQAKKRPKKKDSRASEFQIDYKPSKLTGLLDFKSADKNDYRIIDKDGNEIKIEFNGFLNGRFFTNDLDNSNYFLTKNEAQSPSRKKDPKVISCYRRNYIQILVNMNLSGFMSNHKILKLQSSEYGYIITRVIKWFKIEILANTNVFDNRNVPVIIKEEPKEKEFKNDAKDDIVKPISIDSNEHIITLNESVIKDSEIDNIYVIRKLQFKNATPNNGNLTFQNYYHLKIRLSAVVADLYYDDYIDDEFAATNQDNNEINLVELVSEPIIVRGRNPNFYTEKKDILIKGRSSLSRNSFRSIGRDNEEVEEAEEEKGQEEQSHQEEQQTQDIIEDESSSDDESVQSLNNQKSLPSIMHSKPSTIDINSIKRYNYFPISSVYYLPPINSVYFPHGAHTQQQQKQQDQHNKSIGDMNDNGTVSNERRKSSNVYFK